MASVRGVSDAIREMAARNGFDAGRALDKYSSAWVLRLNATSDDTLMAAAKQWRKRVCPTLGELEDLLGETVAPGGTGCGGCKGSGRRVVMRHTTDAQGRHAHQELSCACTCALGQSLGHAGQMAYDELQRRWEQSENTVDRVVVVDPEPYQRRPLGEWAAARARADAQLATIAANADRMRGSFGAA